MMKRVGWLLMMAPLALPASAWAQPISGIYVGAAGGANISSTLLEKVSTASNFPSVPGLSLNMTNSGHDVSKTGIALSGAVGYGFGNSLRVEIEGAYRDNPLNKFSPAPTTPIALNFSGGERKTSLMFNTLYDFDQLAASYKLPVIPYVGLGAGVSTIDWSSASRHGGPLALGSLGTATSISSIFSSTATVLALQAIVGTSYNINAMPGLSLTADLRAQSLPQNFKESGKLTMNFPSSGLGSVSSSDNHVLGSEMNYSAMLGLRYQFGFGAAK